MNTVYNLGNIEVYWGLKLFLILILTYSGYIITKYNGETKTFRFATSISIILYSLIEGLRWNRGVDYYNYYLELTGGFYERENSELLYQLIIDICSSLFPYWLVFIGYSFLFIYSYTLIIKHFPKTAVWSFPLFFLITEAGAENLIRQFIGISFFLLAFNAYLQKRFKTMLLFLLAIPLIHLSGIFVIIVFLLITLLDIEKRMQKPWLLILIYLVLYMTWDTSYLSGFAESLGSININSDVGMGRYVENADRWFTEEGSISALNNSLSSSTATIIIQFSLNIITIYYGFYLCKKDKKLSIPFWFVYLSIILKVIGGDIELYNRFANWLYYFLPIILGGIICSLRKTKIEQSCIIIIFFFAYIYPLIMSIGKMPFAGCAFVWDK